MKTDTQHIRKSQFVQLYGPGALIESKNGPRLIPSIENGINPYHFSNDKFSTFEIGDTRLSVAIKTITNKDARIFSLPSNASLNLSEKTGIYRTYLFPAYKICYGGNKHTSILYNNPKCPLCSTEDNSSPVRFITACINGHMDEVHWDKLVHSDIKEEKCKPNYYFWKAHGSSLSDIEIECPVCHSKTNMENIYQSNLKCTGRLPERELTNSRGVTYPIPSRPGRCNRKMKVIQRQSSSLHSPNTLTLLTIPEYDNAISRVIQRSDIMPALSMIIDDEQDTFINKLSSNKYISDPAKKTIVNYVTENGLKALTDLINRIQSGNKQYIDFIYEEFDSLNNPEHKTSDNFRMGSPVTIKLDKYGVYLDIYPITKIRTITAQTGYSRTPYTLKDDNGFIQPTIIDTDVFLDGVHWYPGFEGIGEGIFITFHNPKILPTEGIPATSEWGKPGIQDMVLDQHWGNIVFQPIFVWLHTLSHSIIKTISLHTGYSSTSIKERIYVDRCATNGGILIYTTSPGEDGSMGGLVGTVSEFNRIIEEALDNLKFCSNDPLCCDARKTSESINGAACYSCLLISETSCEHRNMWLDRHLVLRD